MAVSIGLQLDQVEVCGFFFKITSFAGEMHEDAQFANNLQGQQKCRYAFGYLYV